jgi:pimeloyl-ACP methyl ester carboxylesterase
MAVDEIALEALRSYEDPRLGIAERFLTPTIGGMRTVGVLSAPIDHRRDTGWVVCHSFGMEQVWLQPLEVAVARSLSAAGFPVLRYHAQGYGDSQASTDVATMASQTRDALDAVDVLARETGIARVGLAGGRVGATIAALAAQRSDASAAILWEPMIDGRRYVDSLLRVASVTELGTASVLDAAPRDPQEIFARSGHMDIQGFPLYRAVFDEMSAFELLSALNSYRGHSLVVQISRSPKPRPELEHLVSHLNEVGGRATLGIVTDPQARGFGFQRYYATPGGQRKEDKQSTMSRGIVSLTVSTCVEWDDAARERGGAG